MFESQMSENSTGNWFIKPMPVIALQILEYVSNKIGDIKSEVSDTQVSKVKDHPHLTEEYIIHFKFVKD